MKFLISFDDNRIITAMREHNGLTRRKLLENTIGYAAASVALPADAMSQQSVIHVPKVDQRIDLPQIHGPSESDEHAPDPLLPPSQRVGYAIVGLGRLSINQILPAFARCAQSQPAALVSGDRTKASILAAQYGIPQSSVYDYKDYEELARNKDVQAIYIVLPNGLHKQYVVRGAKLRKHILCEKPMANSSAEARQMINACQLANVKLMIAYRQQYEPNNLALRELVAAGTLGQLRGFVATNSQQQGDPRQWRLNKELAGGGCLPDVGLYCINAARFLSGQEPISVQAQLWQPKGDARFREVEASVSFSLQFPSGYLATCTTSYDVHKSQMFRLEGTSAWADMAPAFAYHGNKLTWSRAERGREIKFEPRIEEKDQFALELDHFSDCILRGSKPHTPGEEGLRDQLIIEAIYEAARMGRAVHVTPSAEA